MADVLARTRSFPSDARHTSGALSTVFLYLVDVEKSRKECEEFVLAEAKRDAFADAVA